MEGVGREIGAFVVFWRFLCGEIVVKIVILVGFCGHSFAACAAIFLFGSGLSTPPPGGLGCGFSFLFVFRELRRLSSLTSSFDWG